MRSLFKSLFFLAGWLLVGTAQANAGSTVSNSFPLIGNSKYKSDFEHFDYVNPTAPKGGALKLAINGTFDTLNPFSGKGIAPAYIYQTHAPLMIRSADEPFTLYSYVAETIEYPDNFEWVAFNLNPKARFSDGSPIRADDVVFSFNMYRASESVFIQNFYKDVEGVEKISDRRVRFHLKKQSKKVVALVCHLRIHSSKYWEGRTFSGKHLEKPVTSGPLIIKDYRLGQTITFERVKDYWAKDLPVVVGSSNFDFIRVDYLRDRHVAQEGFRAGLYDIFIESDINQWHQSYDFQAVRKGLVAMESHEYIHPASMEALVFNLRRETFKSPYLREAMVTAFDFEWINKKLLHSSFTRFESFYTGSPLAARGRPSDQELELLAPFRDQLPESVFDEPVKMPVSEGSGNNRKNHIKAIRLFKKAGYLLTSGKMIHQKTGKQLSISLITSDPRQERLLLSYKKTLADLGVNFNIVSLDQSQFRKRVRDFDFDMVDWRFWHSMYPGSEQFNMWHSSMAMEKRSGNVAGVSHSAVDQMLEYYLQANEYEDLIPIGRALDRILMSGYYMIPKWYTRKTNIAYWKHLHHPPQNGLHWPNFSHWWMDPVSPKAP